MDNVLKDYRGSSDITDPKLQKLNSMLFNSYPNISTEAMKKVAYMLDTDIWDVYAGEYADYAIGGPTVELFLNSYNGKYGTSYKANVVSKYGATGYSFSQSNFDDGLKLSVSNDTLYVMYSTSKAEWGMWMASPSSNYPTSLIVEHYFSSNTFLKQEGVDDNGYSHYGFRPVICLKSGTQLEKNSDGSYTIVGGSGNEEQPDTGEEPSTENPISTSASYVGNYVDMNGGGEADGIIFADLAVEGSGQWKDSDGNYSYEAKAGLKEYYVAEENYDGVARFGSVEGKLIVPVEGTTGNDRFYIMALKDVNPGTQYYWYCNAYGNMGDYSSATSQNFGTGKINTTNMIAKWNRNEYGAQNSTDMWGVIQSQANQGWFVPSRAEWAAFADIVTEKLGVTTSNYSNYGLKDYYWSSSQYGINNVYDVYFINGFMNFVNVTNRRYVRLCTTF